MTDTVKTHATAPAPRVKIDKLTPEQEQLCNDVAAEWIAIGLSTAPANRPDAEAGVRLAYEMAGHKPPPPFICVKCETPYTLEEVQARFPLRALATVDLSARNEGITLHHVSTGGGDSQPVPCRNEACGGAPLYAGIQWALSPDAAVVLAAALAGGQPSSHLSGFVYGCHAAGWLSFYDAWGRLGIDVHELEGLIQVAKNACWWLPFDCLAIVCDRPERVQLDADHRLHDDKDAAVRFRDGYALHAIHGVTVPERVVTAPETITWQDIDAESNLEVRRVMLNIFGAERYIRDSGAQKVHQDSFGELYRKEVPGDEAVVMVRVVNATPENVPPGTWHWEKNGDRVTHDEVLRHIAWTYFHTGHAPAGYTWFCDVAAAPVYKEYWLRVPPTIETAHEAAAWTFKRTPATYFPTVQT
jgi:hypothetical protein